jgi:hypothetical protein
MPGDTQERLIMIRNLSSLVALLSLILVSSVASAEGGVKVGYIECEVASGWGYVFGSSKDLNCAYHPSDGGKTDLYTGKIYKLGVDVGYEKAAVILWGVFAPGKVAPGSLAGKYGGATASAAWGVGLGSNVLFGGSKSTVALQPVSISGQEGLSAAVGIAGIELTAK